MKNIGVSSIMDKINIESCEECGEHWDCATFLSETFNYSGGNMVFQCQCGNTKTRMFLPTDVMPIEEVMKYVMIQEGASKDTAQSCVDHYKHIQSLKKIGDLKVQ